MGKILIINNANFSNVAVEKVNVFDGVELTLNSIPNGVGAFSGGGDYAPNSQVEISAESINPDFAFAKWSDGNTSNPRTITLGSVDVEYSALFNMNASKIATMGIINENGSIASATFRAYIKLNNLVIGEEYQITIPTGFAMTGWNTDEDYALVGDKWYTGWQTQSATFVSTTKYAVLNIGYGNHTTSDTFTQEQCNANPFSITNTF